jgi:aspartyl-tRNA synthetase
MCGELTKAELNQTVTVCGWVQRRRDLGGVIFIHLRDRTGIIQLVIDSAKQKEIFEIADRVRSEFVLQVTGKIVLRDEENYNLSIATGEIEIICDMMRILDTAQTPPIYIDDNDKAGETVRLEYRYLDLRKFSMQKKIIMRHQTAQIVREFLNKKNFLEIETPMLTKPTPEGARDFLVPSRLQQGSFFALPQSPQLYKQILMVAGFDRYYQIVRCFRDEDLRQDRQPEFTQIDMEMSFVEAEDVMDINEEMIRDIFQKTIGFEIPAPIPRMKYEEAMNRFGSDKPDIRFGMELKDITPIVKDCGFKVFSSAAQKGSVRAINAKKANEKLSRRDLDALTEFVKTYGAKGLAWFVVGKDSVKSPVAKFLTEAELSSILEITDAEEEDIIFVVADRDKVVYDALGQLRLHLAEKLEIEKEGEFAFVWITDFPLLEYSETDGRYYAMHHPFTAPVDEDIPLLDDAPDRVRAKAYDLVVNGMELGGGSIRIHNQDLQKKVFSVMGFTDEMTQNKFGFLLEALKYGTPPHGGLAFGFDRLLMILTGSESIREVIAFPKTQNQSCLMTNAPAPADEAALQELGLRCIL